MEKADLSTLSDEELSKLLAEMEEKDKNMRAEVEEKIGTIEEKLKESRKETDIALTEAIETLKKSIDERKTRISELSAQNTSVKEKATEMNDETMKFLSEVMQELHVNLISEIPVQIDKLKEMEKEEIRLEKELEAKEARPDSRDEMLAIRVRKLLDTWSEKSLCLPEGSELGPVFIAFRDWLSSLVEGNLSQFSSSTVSNDLINALEEFIGVTHNH